MITDRISEAESATLELLEKSARPEFDDICVRLSLPVENIDDNAAPATRMKAVWDLCKQKGGVALAQLEEILRQQKEKPEPLYWLFASISEAERNDVLCRRFFKDLVSRLEPLFPGKDLRYLDEGNPVNPSIWSPWSLRALCKSKVLICLYTKAYFRSPYCGRVWAAFKNRLQRYADAQALVRVPPLIVPLFWGCPTDNPGILPVVARDLDIDHAKFGSQYCGKGLRYVLQQAIANRGDSAKQYDVFLDRFSAQLLSVVKDDSLPPDSLPPEGHIAPLEETPGLFYDFGEENTQQQEQGASSAKFVFFAARSTDAIDKVRKVAAYGDDPRQWRPFYPNFQDRIEDLTNKAAYDAGLEPNVIPLDEDLLQNMRAANNRGNITLVLADPWTLRLAAYVPQATQYNDADLPRSTLLICWNMEDSDTKGAFQPLLKRLQDVFPNKFSTNSPAALKPHINSLSQLRTELAIALVSTRRQVVDGTEDPKVATGLSFVQPTSVRSSPQPNPSYPQAVRAAENDAVGIIPQPRMQGPSGGTEL